MRVIYLLIILNLLLPGRVRSSVNDPVPLDRVNIDHGLSNNSVNCIFQDHIGFMWLGTFDGLNRFDGYTFTKFRNTPADSNSLCHNYIYSIAEDSSYNIWIGTGQGVSIYNPVNQKIHSVKYRRADDNSLRTISSHIRTMAVDTNGTVYIGTNGNGLITSKKGAETARQYRMQLGNYQTSGYNVTSITIDQSGNVWLFVSGVGLCRFYPKLAKVIPISNAITDANVITCDQSGNLLIGASSQLFEYNLAGKQLKQIYSLKHSETNSNSIISLCYTKDQQIWMGTFSSGIIVIDRKYTTIKYLNAGDGPYNLSGAAVAAIFEDKDNRKWLGTLSGGIDIYYPRRKLFQTVSRTESNSSYLPNSSVTCFMEPLKGPIWIGTDGGLSTWDRTKGLLATDESQAYRRATSGNSHVTSIIQDSGGTIWIASFGGGIHKWDVKTKRFIRYRCVNPANKFENTNIWKLFIDHQQRIWAATFGLGYLYYYNAANDKFEVYNNELKDVLSIYQDKNNALWAGTTSHLVKLNGGNQPDDYYEIGKPVRAIHEDRVGNFWIGCEGGGLILFDRSLGKVKRQLTNNQGISNNTILSILEDNKGTLWMGTFFGLTVYRPESNQINTYYLEDGLQSNQFNYGACLKLRDGVMLLGGVRGFSYFKPSDSVTQQKFPKVTLTDFDINNLPITKINSYIWRTSMGQVTGLKVPYNDAAIYLQFAALCYTSQPKIRYAYYLKGWDKDWTLSGSNRYANYTNLREGTYEFHVKISDAEQLWSSDKMILLIKVLPPWYRTWWAYTIYVVLCISLIITYVRYRINQNSLRYNISLANLRLDIEKTQREKAEAEYKINLAEAEMEKMRLEKEQEINAKRLSFFTDISHEFRTPINLIINPLKDLLSNRGTQIQQDSLFTTMYRNARRLLSLLDQLLLFRKAEAGADRLRITLVNLNSVCQEVFIAFEHEAKSRNILYEYVLTDLPSRFYSDRGKIELIIFNLLSNAFKFTPTGGMIRVELKEDDQLISIMVSDTGCGISADMGDRLFERFFQVPHEPSSNKGFGIGLYLVKHFTQSLKGKVTYESKLGKGTTFHVQLPKEVQYSENEIIWDTAEEKIADDVIKIKEPSHPPDKTGIDLKEIDSIVNEKKKMLVVDDDSEMANYIAHLFEDRFIVHIAYDARKGLEIASEKIPDIIISDINMNDLNGVELCVNIKNDELLSHIPVILLTGSSEAEIRLESLSGGADDYIIKPFDNDLLIARVDNILRTRTTLQKFFYNEMTFGRTPHKVAPEHKNFLDNCIRIVESHLTDSDFTVKTLAMELNMGQSNLYKKIKSICGHPPNVFIRFIRLRMAAKLLMSGTLNVTEAAFETGFNDLKYFREQFAKLYNMRPSEYLRTYRKIGNS